MLSIGVADKQHMFRTWGQVWEYDVFFKRQGFVPVKLR